MQTTAHLHDLFPHLRILMGTIIGLGIARLLAGVAGFIQHPGRAKPYPVHLIWVCSLLIELIHFWWWQFALFNLEDWSFLTFAFLIGYSTLLYFIAALLFPDNIAEYDGYKGFFMQRRGWFYSLYALTFLFDLFDSYLKGPDYFARFGYEYLIQVPLGILLCVVGIWSRSGRVQITIASIHLIYQLSWIARLF